MIFKGSKRIFETAIKESSNSTSTARKIELLGVTNFLTDVIYRNVPIDIISISLGTATNTTLQINNETAKPLYLSYYKGSLYQGNPDYSGWVNEGQIYTVRYDSTVDAFICNPPNPRINDDNSIKSALGFTPAALGNDGKVLSSQLPSFVDDVLEYNNMASFPATGESGKIYVAKDTNKTYRWSGSAYVEISASLALGETADTAYRGDRGAAAYKHAVTNKGSAFNNGFYKITTNSEGHVTGAVSVAKSDITGLGIPSSDTTYSLTQDSSNGHKITLTPSSGTAQTVTIPDNDTKNTAGSTDSSSKLFIIGATSQGANPQTYSQDTTYIGTDGHLYSNSKQVINTSDTQALTNKTYNGYTLGNASAKTVDNSISDGSTSTNLPTSKAVAAFVEGKGYVTTDTTYNDATQSVHGLMSTTDKKKLDGIATGATANTASTTTPKANGTATPGTESSYARGDHVHPLQTSVSGNAGTATKLATGNKINGVNFDGSTAITILANPTTTELINNDLNSITTPGLYNSAGGNTCTNKPTGADAFGLQVFKTAGGYVTQELIEGNANPGTRWTRQCNGSSWSTWQEMKWTDTSIDTKNTAGATDTSNKIFLVGAQVQTANPQTYSDNEVYAQNGVLYEKSLIVNNKVSIEYNSTEECLDFKFI